MSYVYIDYRIYYEILVQNTSLIFSTVMSSLLQYIKSDIKKGCIVSFRITLLSLYVSAASVQNHNNRRMHTTLSVAGQKLDKPRFVWLL